MISMFFFTPEKPIAVNCEGCLLMCALFWILSSVLLYGLLFWSLTGRKRNIVAGQNHLCFFLYFFWVESNTKLTRAMLVVVIRMLKWFFNFFICCTPAAPLNVILDSSPWESQSICGIFLSPSMVRFCSVHMEMSRSYLFVFYILIGVYHSQDDDYLKWTYCSISVKLWWSYWAIRPFLTTHTNVFFACF